MQQFLRCNLSNTKPSLPPWVAFVSGARGDPARYNMQPIPQCITCTPSPRTHSSDTSETNPVGTWGLGLAPMHQRCIYNPLAGAIRTSHSDSTSRA